MRRPRHLLLRVFACSLLLGLFSLAGCAKPHYGEPASPTLGTHAGGDAPDSASAPSRDRGGYAKANQAAEAEMAPAGAAVPMDHYDYEEADDTLASDEYSQGLGTQFGESRNSNVQTVPFVRARNRPSTVLSMRYDDADGVDAMNRGRAYWSGPAAVGAQGLYLEILDEYGQPLPSAEVGGDIVAVGELGQRYTLAIYNETEERHEVVVSVDGLDVIDGDTASTRKRGYVLEPWSSVDIEGWRTSEHTVAAFRFSSLEGSYAGRTGKPRNVGVIGAAFFEEDRNPRRADARRRRSADPFPGR